MIQAVVRGRFDGCGSLSLALFCLYLLWGTGRELQGQSMGEGLSESITLGQNFPLESINCFVSTLRIAPIEKGRLLRPDSQSSCKRKTIIDVVERGSKPELNHCGSRLCKGTFRNSKTYGEQELWLQFHDSGLEFFSTNLQLFCMHHH